MVYKRLFEKEENPFTKQFIQTMAQWQNYGIDSDNDPLIKKLNKLVIPTKYKKCNNDLYRVVALEKEVLDNLNNEKKLNTKLFSSWSYDLKIVEGFSKGNYFIDFLYELKNPKVVFFKYKPKPKDIFLNLHLVWNDKLFLQTLENFGEENFDEGVEFRDSQKEVILHKVSLDKSHILKVN